MNGKKKTVLCVLAIAVLISAGALIYNSQAVTQARALNYLSDKYGWEQDSIETISHEKAKTKYQFDLEGGSGFYHNNEIWTCKYNDREFIVERNNNTYADNYQLEDIFQWCTEYLQKNVDPKIVGIETSSTIIYDFTNIGTNFKQSENKVFTKNDAKDVIKYLNENNQLCVFYQVNDLSYYGKKTKTNTKEYRGNENYNTIADGINKSLINKQIATDKSTIILIEKRFFCRRSYAITQGIYTIDETCEYVRN